jgi:hypothetical protein
MTVRLVTTIKKYIGSSIDPKPASSATEVIPAGATFLETDTGEMYHFDGEVWTQTSETAASTDQYLSAILVEIREMKELLVLDRIST